MMTYKETDTLQFLSNKREVEELTREEKKLYKELLEAYEEHAEELYIAHQRAEV